MDGYVKHIHWNCKLGCFFRTGKCTGVHSSNKYYLADKLHVKGSFKIILPWNSIYWKPRCFLPASACYHCDAAEYSRKNQTKETSRKKMVSKQCCFGKKTKPAHLKKCSHGAWIQEDHYRPASRHCWVTPKGITKPRPGCTEVVYFKERVKNFKVGGGGSEDFKIPKHLFYYYLKPL